MNDAPKVVAVAGLISVSVGSANAIFKYKRPPSYRFLIGSGLAYLILSSMAQTDSMGEVAKGLALGVMTTILLGDGGGLMSYFAGDAETDTAKRRILADAPPNPDDARRVNRVMIPNRNGGFRADILPAYPGIPSTQDR